MLTGDRDPGATFAPEDIGWLDFESRSQSDLKKTGVYRYARTVDATVLAFAIGNGPVRVVERGNQALHWSGMPDDLRAHHARVEAGEAIWAAWNAGFDKAVWNYGLIGSPLLEPGHIIDVAAQATAAGLAPDLRQAAKLCGVTRKIETGKELIELFCMPGSVATAASHPTEWKEFVEVYAPGDVTSMREVFYRTRQLSLAEWKEYWAMEAINERGVSIDLAFAHRAAALAQQDGIKSNQSLFTLTRGDVQTVNQVARLVQWLLKALPPEGREMLLKREEEIDEETGEITRPAKFALRRPAVVKLLAYVDAAMEHVDTPAAALLLLLRAKQVLQIRLYGGSKTPMKFKKMLEQHVDGVLMGQYVFNGAAQTGRASSRGVQVHNLARDVLPNERALIEAIMDDCSYAELEAL